MCMYVCFSVVLKRYFYFEGVGKNFFFLKGWEKVRCLDIRDNGGRRRKERGGEEGGRMG